MTDTTAAPPDVHVPYGALIDFATGVFTTHGMPGEHARAAATALCYGDLAGMRTHGLVNLTRLYLPLFAAGRVNPSAEPRLLADTGPAARYDADRGLGLWAAGQAMDWAIGRAAVHGIGLATLANATHIGCAGVHALRAVDHGMIGLLVTNCGRQRIARPPHGRAAMLGTNPLGFAAPAAGHPPFLLDMSTTTVPTGRIRAAARAGAQAPPGWLVDDDDMPVTDPSAFDRGEAHLQWLGGGPQTGAYKGYGLGLLVEVLAALLPGAASGPGDGALHDSGTQGGRDDDIGVTAIAISPGMLRPDDETRRDAASLFGSLLACPPRTPGQPVRYPGWVEAECTARAMRDGVPISVELHRELKDLSGRLGVPDVGETA